MATSGTAPISGAAVISGATPMRGPMPTFGAAAISGAIATPGPMPISGAAATCGATDSPRRRPSTSGSTSSRAMATFPSSIPPQDVAALVPHARDEGSPSRSKCGTPLLVCADATALRSGRSALESAGFAVSRAAGWTEALALSQELQPGVVLVDDAFPTGDGGRLCEALRRLPGGSELPVLMICRNRASIGRALEAGATDVVGKPLDWQVVSRRLARLEKAFRTTQQLDRSQAMLAEVRRVAADASVRLEGQGAFDSLTGLPSRAHLDRLVERALASSRHAGAGVAVLFLDLDRFTEINDSLGRQGGDEALKQVAHRLAECLRK